MASENLFYQLKRPCIFAHRGASAYAPENTIAAFTMAVRQHADAIEMDAKLCADGNVVIIHDQTIDRTTKASGRVAEMTLAELQKLDAGSHFDAEYYGEIIPTLDQVLDAVGKQIYINIELTNYASLTDELPERAAETILRHALADWVMFSSFNPIALLRVRRKLPGAPTALLALKGGGGRLARSRLGDLLKYQALHPHYSDVSDQLVERNHQRRKRVHPFTVNLATDISAMIQKNIDGVITDDPLMARKVFAQPDAIISTG